MQEKQINYRYALEISQRINSFVDNRTELHSFLTYKGFNLWQGYQGVLFSDAKIWSQSRRVSWIRRDVKGSLKLAVSAILYILISVAGVLYLFLSKKRVLVFTGDRIEGKYRNDIRLDSLYQVLNTDNVPYLEVVHTIPSRDTFKKFLKRGRGVIYVEAIDFLIAPIIWRDKKQVERFIAGLGLSEFSESESKFVRFELLKFLSSRRIMMARLNFFSWVLKLSKVERMFTIDDVRHYNEFVAAGRLRGVLTVAIQHGHFTKYHTGWIKMTSIPGEIIKPNILLVWSTYWKEELLSLGSIFTQGDILTGERQNNNDEFNTEIADRIAVLVPYEKDAPKSDIRAFITDLIDNNIEVVFKLRADQDKLEQLDEYGLEELIDKITVVESLDEVGSKISAAVGTYSTLLYDMVEMRKPVAILETLMDYGEGMVRNGLADLIKKESDFAQAVKKLSETSNEEIEVRRNKLIGTERRRMASVIRDIIREHVSA